MKFNEYSAEYRRVMRIGKQMDADYSRLYRSNLRDSQILFGCMSAAVFLIGLIAVWSL